MLLRGFLAMAVASSFAFGATQTFYQASSFQTNVFLHDSPIALHLRISGMLTNVDWGDITGTITNQTDLQNALDAKANTSAIPVVGVTAGTFYDGAQGDAVSNAVAGLTNDVAVLQTNTATKAQGALADTALQVEADTNALFQLNAHATNAANPHGVTAAQIGAATGSPLYEFTEVDPAYATGGVQRVDTNGWVVSPHEAWLTAEVDPAYATGAVQIAGATMTGPMTNEFGYFGNGAGLTNLASDPSGWSGYAATQQVVWYSDEIADDTNYLVISGSSEPETAGVYQWANSNEVWAYWKSGDKVAPQGEDFWYISTPFSEFRNMNNDPTAMGFDAYFNATGTVSAAYGKMTNLVPWRAGYDTNSTHWVISCNGTNIQEWSRTSNYETVYTIIKGNLHVDNGIEAGALQAETFISAPAYYLNGVYRETWPSEYSDTAIYGALNTVSNWTIAGSNLAANALPTTGGTMAGPLTNEHGYFGDGSGLTNLPGSTPFDGTELSNSVVGLGILITNAAEQATNYADSVGSAVGLVASNALPMDGGGTVTGDVAVTGGVTAGTLALTNGPVAGSVWVCTNANGSGALRVLAKCQIFPQGSIPTSNYYTNAVWTTNGMFNIGDMTANARGIQVNRAGTYMASYVYNIEGITSTATRVRGRIVIDGAGINYGPLVLSAGVYASVSETAIASCASGSVISVMYYLYNSDEGLTNRATQGGHFSVIELP